jgi:hypothetical protein
VAPVVRRQLSDAIAREIAALDNVYAVQERRQGSAGEYYQSRRAELLDKLVRAQAVEEQTANT